MSTERSLVLPPSLVSKEGDILGFTGLTTYFSFASELGLGGDCYLLDSIKNPKIETPLPLLWKDHHAFPPSRVFFVTL